jgi:hypothetical protein
MKEMKKIMKVALLAVCCTVILSVSTVSAKSNSASSGDKNGAELCIDIVPVLESIGYGVTMGQCVSAFESANPAMYVCRMVQMSNPFIIDDYFGNFGQCLKEVNRLSKK